MFFGQVLHPLRLRKLEHVKSWEGEFLGYPSPLACTVVVVRSERMSSNNGYDALSDTISNSRIFDTTIEFSISSNSGNSFLFV